MNISKRQNFVFLMALPLLLQIFVYGCIADKKILTSQQASARAGELIANEWRNIERKEFGWQYRISPPFPAEWPANKDHQVIFYAFAAMINPQKISDGEHIAAPWATVRLDAAGLTPPTITIIEKSPVDLGIQGVRPLNKEETDSYKDMGFAEDAILKSSDSNAVKKAYCVWIKNNSVISGKIKLSQQSFFDWLKCESL